MERHQTTSRLFNAVNDTSASSTTTTTTSRKSGSRFSGPTSNASDAEMSLSKVKLQNAVDLASSLLDPKQQRRMIQTLIDADAKVIDEERVALDQMAHRRRLAQIRSGKPPNNHDSYAEINHRSMVPLHAYPSVLLYLVLLTLDPYFVAKVSVASSKLESKEGEEQAKAPRSVLFRKFKFNDSDSQSATVRFSFYTGVQRHYYRRFGSSRFAGRC